MKYYIYKVLKDFKFTRGNMLFSFKKGDIFELDDLNSYFITKKYVVKIGD